MIKNKKNKNNHNTNVMLILSFAILSILVLPLVNANDNITFNQTQSNTTINQTINETNPIIKVKSELRNTELNQRKYKNNKMKKELELIHRKKQIKNELKNLKENKKDVQERLEHNNKFNESNMINHLNRIQQEKNVDIKLSNMLKAQEPRRHIHIDKKHKQDLRDKANEKSQKKFKERTK